MTFNPGSSIISTFASFEVLRKEPVEFEERNPLVKLRVLGLVSVVFLVVTAFGGWVFYQYAQDQQTYQEMPLSSSPYHVVSNLSCRDKADVALRIVLGKVRYHQRSGTYEIGVSAQGFLSQRSVGWYLGGESKNYLREHSGYSAVLALASRGTTVIEAAAFDKEDPDLIPLFDTANCYIILGRNQAYISGPSS